MPPSAALEEASGSRAKSPATSTGGHPATAQRAGVPSLISDENVKLTTGQDVDSVFGSGVVLDIGKSGSDRVSIQTKWGVVHASSPTNIGICAQTSSQGDQAAVAMDLDEEKEEIASSAVSDDEDKTPKDTHYGTLLNSGRSVDVTTWTPKEKSLFEVAMWECDKDFTEAARIVGTKTFSDCAKFYYCSWKLARSHRRWKQVRLPPRYM
jgi:hypothetical protein